MSRALRWLLLGLLATGQIAVCAWMIGSRQLTLAEGSMYKLQTAPVDPYDPFQGRYVTLNLIGNPVMTSKVHSLENGQRVYVPLVVGEDGFAKLADVLPEPPEGDYVKAWLRSGDATKALLELPFERYYANEKLAPEIERAYVRNSSRENRNAYIVIRVRGGQSVLEELYIDDLPVREFLRREAQKIGKEAD